MSQKAVIFYAMAILKDRRNRIMGVIQKWCRNSCDFEDIIQNIMLKVLTTSSRFEGRSQVFTWLYRIAVNESIDFFRRNRRFTKGRVDLSNLQLAVSSESPEKEAENAEGMEIVSDILRGLSQAYQSVFILYFLNEMTVREMAVKLRISENAVRCKITQAKQRVVREMLSRRMISDPA